MSENVLITDIFTKFQHSLDSDQETREVIRTICKEIDQISREAVTYLQIIHHKEEGIAQACQKTRGLFEKAREGYMKLKEAVPPTDYFKYHDHWRWVTQRYSFLIALVIWLEVGVLASHETVADILGTKRRPLLDNFDVFDLVKCSIPVSAVEEKEGFHLDIEDYLIGLLQLCSELSRLAVNAVTRGDYNRPLQISRFVMELNAGFRLLNLKNDHLRKRFDALKYDVKKIEEVVYDLSIRGMLPKTQEDKPEDEKSNEAA